MFHSNPALPPPRPPALRFRPSGRPEVLSKVRRPDVDIACWRRDAPAFAGELADWVGRSEPPEFDEIVSAKAVDAMAVVAAAPASIRAAVAEDVSMLLGYFAAAGRASELRLFFGAVRDDRCRKFHVDAVAMRLVTTYVGPGTEWVPEAQLDRDALARLIPCPMEANRAIVRDPKKVRRAQPGDVLMLKGSRHPNAGRRGAVHRSPPLPPGEARLVLIVTAARAAER